MKALESANLQALTLNRNFEAFISQSEEAAGLAIHKREEGIHSSLANAQELQKVLISITDISVTKLFGSIETMREQSVSVDSIPNILSKMLIYLNI